MSDDIGADESPTADESSTTDDSPAADQSAAAGGRTTLTPTQQRILQAVRRSPEPLVFDDALVDELVDDAQAALADLTERLGGERLNVNKSFLQRVHGCEVLHVQPDDFTWTAPRAAGFVAHKAIELAFNWRGEATPGQVVDEALARLADQETSRGDFVAGLSDGDRADLRGRAIERTTRFLQDFPPIPGDAHPMLEAAVKWRPAGTIEFSGKADMVIGRPHGRESRRLIIDFKSGGRSPGHRDDLRFYALLETLSQRVPPRKLVTYYLDYSDTEVEDVTSGVLRAALTRTLEGIARHVELHVEGRPPVKRVGAPCRWCPLKATCPEGAAYLRGDDPFDVPDDS